MPCRACGLVHSALIRCEQAAAINRAAINADVRVAHAINKDVQPKTATAVQKAVSVGTPDRSANRRSREAYNAYMRDYMSKRRRAMT